LPCLGGGATHCDGHIVNEKISGIGRGAAWILGRIRPTEVPSEQGSAGPRLHPANDRHGEASLGAESVERSLVAKLAKLPVADVIGWMTAFFQEGCKRNVGKAHELLAGFAKQLVWTNAMVKGLLDGLADSQDADSAQEALQTIVDTIGDEYGIFPRSELETEKEQAA
jgi:hypothetical protein